MSGIAGNSASSGSEPPEDGAGWANPAGGSPGPPASRREVLRDLGGMLSVAAILPVMSSLDPVRPGGGGAPSTGGRVAGDLGAGDLGGGLGSMLVPAYFHPAQLPAAWSALTDPRLLAVVLNIADGPGHGREPAFAAAAASIEAAGGTVTGYVDAGYGARSVAEMETAARLYRDWYEVADVFLDQVPAGAATLPTYQAVGARLRARGAEFIVFNHGVYPDAGYAAIADLLITFEGPWAAYQQMEPPPAWAASLPPWRFCHLVYGVPADALDQAVRLAGERRVGVLYVTDGQGANPWNGLPGYFDREVTLVCGA
jgi:hypothetical protein